MRCKFRVPGAIVLVTIICVAGFITQASAQQFTSVRPDERAGTWEFFMPLIYSDSFTINGQNGSSVKVNDDWGFGFGFGYNITDHFQMNGLVTWSYRSYDASIVDTNGDISRRYSDYMDSTTLGLNGIYYILKGKILPFVSAGIGWTYVDIYVPSGSGSTACWWDPWYGYVCDSYLPTRTEDDITYTAGVGVRFEFNPQVSMQLGYYKMWLDVERSASMPDFDNYRLEFIFRM